jgi:hypothetical protein
MSLETPESNPLQTTILPSHKPNEPIPTQRSTSRRAEFKCNFLNALAKGLIDPLDIKE